MIRLKARWKWFIKELSKTDGRMWFLTLFFSIILLIAAFILLVLAGHFLNTNFRDLPPLPDLGHQILPLWDLRFLFQIGLIASLIVFIIGGINEPHRMPYFFFMASFWFLIRIASMTVTPFFSGHTGLPFLGYLIFRRQISYGLLAWPMLFITGYYLFSLNDNSCWIGIGIAAAWIIILLQRKKLLSLSLLFLTWSFIMAATVILTRNHYTIDVIGAYFMTAGIVVIGRYFFDKVEKLCEKMEQDFKTED